MAKPFKYNGMKPAEQLRLFAGRFDWLDVGALDGYADEVGMQMNPNESGGTHP